MIKCFCNRCQAEANIISRVFTVDHLIHMEVITRAAENGAEQPHICEDCLADLMMESIKTFRTAKAVIDYHEAFRTAIEMDKMRKEIEALSEEKMDLFKRIDKAEDAGRELQAKLIKTEEDNKLLQAMAVKAKKDADLRIRQTEGQLRQKLSDEQNDPEYVAAVHRRERLRSGAQ